MVWRLRVRLVQGAFFLGVGAAAFVGWAEARQDYGSPEIFDDLAKTGFARGRLHASDEAPPRFLRLAASKANHVGLPSYPTVKQQQPANIPPKLPKEVAKESPKNIAPASSKPASVSPDRSKDHGKDAPSGVKDSAMHPQAKAIDAKSIPKNSGKAGAPHLTASEPRHVSDAAKEPLKDMTPKIQDRSAKQHPSDPIAAAQAAAKQKAREAETKQQDTSKQRLKEEMAKLFDAPKHALPAAAAKAAKEKAQAASARDQHDGSKSRDKDSDTKRHADLPQVHSKDADAKQHHGKLADRIKAAKEKAEAEAAAAKAKAEAEAKAAADAAAKAKAIADAAAAKAKADADLAAKKAADAKAKLASTPVPQIVVAPKDAQQPGDKVPDTVVDAIASQVSQVTQVAASVTQTSGSLVDSPSKLGGPTQDLAPDGLAKSLTGQSQNGASQQQAGSQSQAAGGLTKGVGRALSGLASTLPPAPDSYKPHELLVVKPAPEVLAELKRRGLPVVQDLGKSDVARVTLPVGAADPFYVQRDLKDKFPEQAIGLNFIYKPYYGATKPGSAQQPPALPRQQNMRCTDDTCYGPKLIAWHKSLETCAAGLTVGMIDTLVNQDDPAFRAGGHVKSYNIASRADAAPARHWHGTGVLSLMAGVPGGPTPGLIPNAEFRAVNAFFTNRSGELETDTAHLTEALAKLEEQGVRIVNLSLVGPSDEIVHRRIRDMATKKGIVFVAAAGNNGPDAPPGYPAAYEEVIAVTAVDRNGGSYDHANRGDYIDVAAPGVRVWAALPEGDVGLLTGTSFAAPFVTSVIAVGYRDTDLGRQIQSGQAPLDPKGTILNHLFGKAGLKKKDATYGYGILKAPSACGGGHHGWGSIVKLTPSDQPPAGLPTIHRFWGTTRVQRASLPADGR